MPDLELTFPDRSEAFSVRGFRIEQALNAPFGISLSVRSELEDADLDGLAGHDAALAVGTSAALGDRVLRWTGICAHAELVHAEPSGLSTYALTLVPRLWLLTQRSGCRVFRRMTAPEIACAVLRDFDIRPELRLDESAYPVLDFRVQYNETDFAFVSRTLEEAGIAYFFREVEGQSTLVLVDRPGVGELHTAPLTFLADASAAAGAPYATRLYRASHVRPGAYRVRDYDLDHPGFDLAATARAADGRFERYENLPGASFVATAGRGAAAEPSVLAAVAARRLDAARADRKVLSFETNVIDLAPGALVAVAGHPRHDLDADTRLLVTHSALEGTAAGEVHVLVKAVFAGLPYRPPLVTPRPFIAGVQTATVVGPTGQEIHVDPLGRVRVLFPWDQAGAREDGSSCWVRVSQTWAGAGFGVAASPRVGDEVLVAFVDGDPDEPVIVGRLHNATHQPPFPLPRSKTRTGIVTRSSRDSAGYNELSFEDRAGHERVLLRAERDLDVQVQRNETRRVGATLTEKVAHNRFSVVGGNVLGHVSGDVTAVTDGDERATTMGSRTTRVRGNVDEHVEGSVESTVDGSVRRAIAGAALHTVTGPLETVAKGGVVLRSLGSVTAVVGTREAPQAAVLAVEGSCHARSSGLVELESEAGFELRCGDSVIAVTPDGVEIRARSIRLRGEDAWATLAGGEATLHAESKAAATAPEIVLVSDGASLALASEAKLAGAKVKLGAGAQASASIGGDEGEPTVIELVDQHGAPVPRARYALALADGSVREGLLDERGRAEVRLTGSATITFPSARGVESA